MTQFGSSAALERAIVEFISLHPEGVTSEQMKKQFKNRPFGKCMPALIRYGDVIKINEDGEVYDYSHFRNRGEFKFYPGK